MTSLAPSVSAQAGSREQVLIIIDLLEPLDPGAEHFAAAKNLLASDVNALFDELERESPRADYLMALFDRTERSLALLGDEGGYTAPAAQQIVGKRSLENYRELERYFARLRAQTTKAPPEPARITPPQPPAVQAAATQESATKTVAPPAAPVPNATTRPQAAMVEKPWWRKVADWLLRQE